METIWDKARRTMVSIEADNNDYQKGKSRIDKIISRPHNVDS